MHKRTHAPVTKDVVEEIVRETRADHRSVIARLAGLTVRGAAGAAIDRAIAARGIRPASISSTTRVLA